MWQLDVTLLDWDGKSYHAQYNQFSIGPEASDYTVKVDGFDKVLYTLSDSLSYHSNRSFSTFDRDNDSYDKSCSE